jgi:IPT/TIG domain
VFGEPRHIRLAASAVIATLVCTVGGATLRPVAAAARPASTASRPAQPSAPAYLTVMIGRALASKAVGCATPAGMLTLDTVVQDLAAVGVNVTVPVIPGRTLATGTNCIANNLYPSWADLTNLATTYGLNAVSASQSYAHMTSLATQAQEFKQSCGSLSAFVANGFRRAWGLFAYPDNMYSSTIQTSVVQDCFAFGRTYADPHTATGSQLTNTQATIASPWLQVTDDIGGGKCNDQTQPCYTEGPSTTGRYLPPATLHNLTIVAPGTWTSLQAYTFVNGASAPGSTIKWDCTSPNWQEHWTSLYEVYCWNDFLTALTGIPSSVTITDPVTVAQAWGRIPTPVVSVTSLVPSLISGSVTTTRLTWFAEENGTYAVLAGGEDCTSGTQVASGSYTKSPSPLAVTIAASALPSGTSTLRVCLTDDPGHVGSAQTAFTLISRPAVTSVSPLATALSVTAHITITGANFTTGASVKVGGSPANGVTVISPTVITATMPGAPGGHAGTYNVVVTDSQGTSASTAADEFSYEVAPSVTSVSQVPTSIAGGTAITITGTNFYPDATVKIGGSAPTSVVVNSATTITAVVPGAPGGIAGAYDVMVSDAGGTSPATPADTFTYEALPTVTAIAQLPTAVIGGTSITITGANFYPDATVTVGGTSATSVVVSSAATITAVVPAAPGGVATAYDVVVSEAGGSSPTTPVDLFTYEAAPSVTAVTQVPTSVIGGTPITITGTNFSPDATVTVGVDPATEVVVTSTTTITAVVSAAPSAGAGTYDVVVTDGGGSSPTSPVDDFTYEAAPSVTGISQVPTSATGGTSITITGTSFYPDATVTVGVDPATDVVVTSTTTITAVVPAAPSAGAGTYDVVVTDGGGSSPTSPVDDFTYEAAPSVTNVDPPSGSVLGGTPITITGTGFSADATVTIDGAVATDVVVDPSGLWITATTPAPPDGAGAYDVDVSEAGGLATAPLAFTYS